MPRGKKFTAEQIIGKLREAEVGLAQGKSVPGVVRKLGVTEQTYYRWKREYGGAAGRHGVPRRHRRKPAEGVVGGVDPADAAVREASVEDDACPLAPN
jgi:transposase-like protein